MNESVWLLIISLAAMIGGAAIGAWLRARLPGHHLNDQAASVIKSGVGLISTLAALDSGLADLDGENLLRFDRVSSKPDIIRSGLG